MLSIIVWCITTIHLHKHELVLKAVPKENTKQESCVKTLEWKHKKEKTYDRGQDIILEGTEADTVIKYPIKVL